MTRSYRLCHDLSSPLSFFGFIRGLTLITLPLLLISACDSATRLDPRLDPNMDGEEQVQDVGLILEMDDMMALPEDMSPPIDDMDEEHEDMEAPVQDMGGPVQDMGAPSEDMSALPEDMDLITPCGDDLERLGEECELNVGPCALPGEWRCDAGMGPIGEVICAPLVLSERTRCERLSQCQAGPDDLGTWLDLTDEQTLTFDHYWAQTHLIRPVEMRSAPQLIMNRAALLLVHLEQTQEEASAMIMRVSARAHHASGEVDDLGTLELTHGLPALLDDELSNTPLPTPSELALLEQTGSLWSVQLPAHWMREGATLLIGGVVDSQGGAPHRSAASITLQDLAPPHVFTLTRSKIVLFGDLERERLTQDEVKVSEDYFPTLPFSKLRFVDTSPWILPSVVTRTPLGPRLAHSEGELRALTEESDHWSIIKNQFALRLSLANTGRGLTLIEFNEGDNSPFSYGTSVGMGWYRDDEGIYHDIDDAPWAAGWTGWTAMWANECGNGFTHEVGHSFTLAHFNSGVASQWGIGEEYPLDGTYTAFHPTPYDTTRRGFRTWYRVNSEGPVYEDDAFVGKRDPMNGGEAPNQLGCFPHYTAYHTQKIQNRAINTPTLHHGAEGPGVYQWSLSEHRYTPTSLPEGVTTPLAINVPVVTVIGTLGANEESLHIYPPIYSPSGNLFALPTFDEPHHPRHEESDYFIEIEYDDAQTEVGSIGKQRISSDDRGLWLFSLNIDASREPVSVRLYERTQSSSSPTEGATLRFTRALDDVSSTLTGLAPPPISIGGGESPQRGLLLTQLCEPRLNCAHRGDELWLNEAEGALTFHLSADETVTATLESESACGTDELTASEVELMRLDEEGGDLGERYRAVLHTQRITQSSRCREVRAAHDSALSCLMADTRQGLRAWLPWDENLHLPTGHYQLTSPILFHVWKTALDGRRVIQERPLPLRINLEKATLIEADLTDGEYSTASSSTPASSIYYLTRDSRVGPTSRVWWQDSNEGPTPLSVDLISNDSSGAPPMIYPVRVWAQNSECMTQRYDLNAGRSANECPHAAILWLDDSSREALPPGSLYTTASSEPLWIDARRWHQPNAQTLLDAFSLQLRVDLRD